ncbi:uncharacterized protein FOMMEDRAFT_31108 [Fomitiporia mediterranea MF3/22]|uniref:uncharacterized protein n=1 Tax=Fomitiporia mediterranea (strain MF3/22) TaxID=694068 RepID=UPI0004409552|nr:uncharacterized protein FOMMEDRAFT_31108 [Fomitiporia mediterranea MF3/22]EJC99872.1 hypothetical protein FOMMEDRAFT_31108 [Fomitiporia mediterranea MF3/22]
MTCLLTYDAILGFVDERRLMWSKPLNSGKILYFLIKYLTVIFSVVALFTLHNSVRTQLEILILFLEGNLAIRTPWISSVIITILTEALSVTLQLRLYALYKARNSMAIVLGVSLMATVASMFGVGIAIMVNESGTLLEAYKGVDIFREKRELGIINQLELFLVKGSVIYFFIAVASWWGMNIVHTHKPVTAKYVPFATAITAPIASLMSQRLLLGLRDRYGRAHSNSFSTLPDFVALQGPEARMSMGTGPRINTPTNSEADWLISFSE